MRIKKPVQPVTDYPALCIVWLYRFAANTGIRFLRFLLFGQTPEQPGKILIFRTGSLGDSICALPAIAHIRKRYPQAQLDILTNAGAASLVSMQKLLHRDVYNEMIDYYGSSVPELASRIKQNGYSLVIELPQYDGSLFRLLRNMIFFRLKTGIKSGFGWKLDNVNFFKKAQHRNIVFSDERTRLLNIISKHTGAAVTEQEFPMAASEADRQAVSNWINTNLPGNTMPILAIVPGAKRPANTWPQEYFAQLVNHFAPQMPIVLCGGENEKELAASLTGNVTNVWNACGVFTPVQTGIFFGKCRLVITNDTGPLHLAYSAGTPLVSVFSNRDYAHRWFPPQNIKNKTLRATDISCAPCFLEACPYNNKCLRAIEVQEVINAAEALLAR